MLKLKHSYQELFHTECVVNTGILLAISIALGGLSISIGNYLRISFSVLPQQIICFLYGPIVGIIFGAVSDILRFIAKPSGPFFPGFTISSMLYGLIYGFFLYQKRFTYKNIVFSNILAAIIVNILLNTYWLSILYGQLYTVILPLRILKESLVLPFEILISIFVMKHMNLFFKRRSC